MRIYEERGKTKKENDWMIKIRKKGNFDA